MTIRNFNDDDFDWEAAVSEIDQACSKAETALRPSEPRLTQKLKQKTLDCFIRENRGKQHNDIERQQQTTSDCLRMENAKQCRNEGLKARDEGFRDRNTTGRVEDKFHSEVPIDPDAARSWIYPANVPCRTYQFDITKVALFSNTLVSLPTGLGKTLIAAAVMFNFFRWFPTGKIVFAAPSRPLVVQQIEACHKVTGIPQDMTIDMTGEMSPSVRAEYWQSRRVFFVTPQCLEKDIKSGTCTSRQIVCLVIDEAHRATGNYSYCVVVRELLAAKINYRLLALTATPGSKQITIQAVVDNLQISCLEYRDEHDPDVSQYTHNRKVELIEVPMNAESNQVKDLLIEVMQPIVFRLCHLRVFYNREISRLTPYEFIQARERFRQAPPQSIPQNEYPQVEMYFGLAITLTHIFKLLFTHGMRPAYEMLQQKMQQGVLKRLGGNDKMRHLQSVMKQTIGYGAPSPKLDKVVDIISTHFCAHDPTKTRVIIFTNFRESVKDIMEILAAKCTDVKAMEFIGQSSGKTSKGQSQKTQQAVLQKFRAGGFNTIVATSIAEEGLDIMEVDLVICFDANISPLRMIQRMGRTGRKRDGRVVVLACEGSEKEGYLKKQSKNKALNKHMCNGGIQSFNFHPSSPMIPHSYRPAVQLVELAIEDYVPRTKKQKAKETGSTVGGLRILSEEDYQILEKWKISPDVETWKPSLIAFPQYQLIPTPVYRVKHSSRTSMLIDALQEISGQITGVTQPLGDDKITPLTEGGVNLDQDRMVNEIHETIVLSCTPEKTESALEVHGDKKRNLLVSTSAGIPENTEETHTSCLGGAILIDEGVKSTLKHITSTCTKENSSPSAVNVSSEGGEVPVHPITIQHEWGIALGDWNMAPPTRFHGYMSGAKDILTDTETGNHYTTVDHEAQEISAPNRHVHHPQKLLSPSKTIPGETNFSTILAMGLHRCKYSSGVVSTTQLGLIVLSSPPPKSAGKYAGKLNQKFQGHNKENCGDPMTNGTSLSTVKLATRAFNMPSVNSKAHEPQEKNKLSQDGSPVARPMSPIAEVHENFRSVSVKAGDNLLHSTAGECKPGKDQLSAFDIGNIKGRLADIASDGIVPSSPVAKAQFEHEDIPTSPVLNAACTFQRIHSTPIRPQLQQLNTPQTPATTRLPTESLRKDDCSQSRNLTSDSKLKKTPVSSFLCRIHGLSPPKGKLLDFTEDFHEDSFGLRFCETSTNPERTSEIGHSLRERDLPTGRSFTEDATTPQAQRRKSLSEEWEVAEGEGSASVQRPRKLKRLCKAGEKPSKTSSYLNFKRLKEVSAPNKQGNKYPRLDSKAGKEQRKLMVKDFFDEEAEVSEDEESSDQYDGDEEDEDEADGFIDTAGTQHLNGPVDMMAIYRRSLLTQSPMADLQAKYGHLVETSPTTCSDETTRSSEELSLSTASVLPEPASVTLGVETSTASHNKSVQRKSSLHQESRFNQKSVTHVQAGNTSVGSDFPTVDPLEDHKKAEMRKRKLSFQINPGSADAAEPLRSQRQSQGILVSAVDATVLDCRGPLLARNVEISKPPHSSPQFEDDLFDGVDLDALEAAAAQTARIRSQQVVCANQENRQDSLSCPSSAVSRTQMSGLVSCRPRPLTRLRKDDNFDCFPSFDLGIAD